MVRPASFDWKGWLSWIAATIAGVELVVMIAYFAFQWDFSDSFYGELAKPAVGFVTLGVAGTAFATMQWIWLRRRMRNAIWWIAATVFGWYLAALLFALLSLPAIDQFTARLNADTSAGILAFCLLSLVASLPQWLLLRRNYLRAGYWALARPLGWYVGLGLVFLGEYCHLYDSGFFSPYLVAGQPVTELVGWCVIGLFFALGFGAVSGVAMVQLRTKPQGPAGGSRFADAPKATSSSFRLDQWVGSKIQGLRGAIHLE